MTTIEENTGYAQAVRRLFCSGVGLASSITYPNFGTFPGQLPLTGEVPARWDRDGGMPQHHRSYVRTLIVPELHEQNANLPDRISAPGVRYKSFVFNETMAGEPGFEPRLTESESVVLPLNYSPAVDHVSARPVGEAGL